MGVDQYVVGGDEYDFIVGIDQCGGYDFVVVFVGLDGDYVFGVMVVMGVFGDWGMFVEVVFGGGEYGLLFVFGYQQGDDLLGFFQVYVVYVMGGMVYWMYVVFIKMYGFVVVGEQYYVMCVIGQGSIDQEVVFVQVYGDDVGFVWVGEV